MVERYRGDDILMETVRQMKTNRERGGGRESDSTNKVIVPHR